MFKEERRRPRGASFAVFPHLPLVSLVLILVTVSLAAEEVLPPGPGPGIVATDLEEPAEFVPEEGQALELKLQNPAEVPLGGNLGGNGDPSAVDGSENPRRGPSLAQPDSVAGAILGPDAAEAVDMPGTLNDPEQGATSQEIEEVQEQIRAAHALAKSAKSSQELTAIIELCKQGEESTRWLAGRGYFRRLASWAHNRRGEERVTAGQDADALEDFHQALKLDSRNWRAAHNRGVSYAQMGELETAVQDLALTIQLKPDHGAAYRNRGEIYFEWGRYADAIEDYTRALTCMPDRDELYYLRADAHYRLGNLQKALADYQLSLEARKQPERLVGRASVHAALGDYEAAIHDLDQAIRLDSQSAEAYRAVAWILATCPDSRYRRPDKALLAARHALKLQGNSNPLYFDTLAAAYAATASFDQAASIQQHAVSLAAGTEEKELLATRLALYRQHQPYVSGTKGQERTASQPHASPPATRPSMRPVPAQPSTPSVQPYGPMGRATGAAGIRPSAGSRRR